MSDEHVCSKLVTVKDEEGTQWMICPVCRATMRADDVMGDSREH